MLLLLACDGAAGAAGRAAGEGVTLGTLLWLVARGLGLAALGALCLLLIPVHWLLERGAIGLIWLADRVVTFVAWAIEAFEDWKRDVRASEARR
ncbi:hypothetical protein [Sorangium sp. So ce388]|uniref:hypothetical protein n=1 Tax=Sorangium sp. So ce388 TaxID=3133309 RepID=UPI003F5B7704